MQNDYIANIDRAGKQAFDAVKEVTALNSSTFETLLEKQLEIANQLVTLGTRQAQIFGEIKDAPSAFQAQSALFQEISDQAAGNTRDTVEFLTKTQAAYDKLFQKGLKNATDTAKKAQAGSKAAA